MRAANDLALKKQARVTGPAAGAATAAAPRKKANGDDTMRPWRIGTRSGSRVSACSSRMAMGSRRFGAGSHRPWLERGTRLRADLPRRTCTCGPKPEVPLERAPPVTS